MNNEGYPIYGEEEDPQVAINTRDIATLNQEVASFQTEINTATQDIDILKLRVDDIDDVVIPSFNKQLGVLGKEVDTITDGLRGANSEIGVLTVDLDTAQKDIDSLSRTVKTLDTQVASLSTQIANLSGAGDIGSIVLTCPSDKDDAKLTVDIPTDWRIFYQKGYKPTNSPFHMTTYVSGNMNLINSLNPSGLFWIRPTTSSADFASFEVDASTTFIPSHDMGVRLSVAIYDQQFATIPMYDLGYNERYYQPSTAVTTWSIKMIISLPLKKGSVLAYNILFDIASIQPTGTFGLQFVYGVGEKYTLQHQLVVKRIA